MAILFIEFIRMIPVSLVSCSLWHHRLQSVAFPPIVSQLRWQIFKLSILNTSKSVLNSTDVCTFLSMNNFHLSMNVNQRHVFCSQELLSLHTYLHWHTHISPSCVYEHSSDLCIKRSLKFGHTVQGGLRNWTQFILYSCMLYVFLLYEAIRRRYFSGPLDTVFLLRPKVLCSFAKKTYSLRLVFVKFSYCDDIIIYKATNIFVWKPMGVGYYCNFVSNYMLQHCYGVDLVKDYCI